MPGYRGRVEGQSFHVRDSYIWAEIHYLDSPTDYRECLPQHATTARVDSELIFLDSQASDTFSRHALSTLSFWSSIISGVALCILVYTSF